MSDDNRNLLAKYKIQAPQGLAPTDVVMIVEDQQDLRLIIAHQLGKLGLGTAKQSGNGYEAVEMVKNQELKVAAYVCDLEMPVMNGLDFLAELRENTKLDRGPFCLTMDNPSKEKLMLAVENGVDEILVKPFTLGDIGPKLRAAFAKFHNPANPERVYELAKGAFRDGKLDAADKIYQDLAAASPKSARPVVGMARIEMKRDNPQKAMQLLDEAEQKNKSYVHLFTERAKIHVAQSNWQPAIDCFRKAIELSPLNAIRYKEAADLLFKVKRYEEASTLLEMAIKQSLQFPDLFHYLSQAKFALKDYKAAQKYIRSALGADPENVNYLNQLGICFKQTDQLDEALKTYNQVIKIDPSNVEGLYNKAVLQNSKGETDDAIKLLERLLRKNPEFEPGRNKLQQYQKELADKKKPGAA